MIQINSNRNKFIDVFCWKKRKKEKKTIKERERETHCANKIEIPGHFTIGQYTTDSYEINIPACNIIRWEAIYVRYNYMIICMTTYNTLTYIQSGACCFVYVKTRAWTTFGNLRLDDTCTDCIRLIHIFSYTPTSHRHSLAPRVISK